MKKFTAKQEIDLKSFTDITYPQGSFYFSRLLRSSDIRVNGVKVSKNLSLRVGDEVTYYTTPKQEQKASHLCVYEDDKIYVADKHDGVSTEALACELSLIPAHRLDRNTSGVMLFAKSQTVADGLIGLFRLRRVNKKYLCFAKNSFASSAAVLTAYLSKDERASRVTVSDSPKSGYVAIVTEYKVLREFGDYALVEVALHTGRTHQIRAHLAHIGCPVLGDEKYGDEALNAKYSVRRQCLVCKQLSFELNGKEYSFESSFVPQLPCK